MTADEVKNLLRIYYDIPQMIAEEFATTRNCQNKRDKITLPPVNLSGMPCGKGMPGDRTASMAFADQTRYYDEEILKCSRRIAELWDAKNWLGVAPGKMDPTDRYIFDLRYIMRNQRHHGWAYCRASWTEIAGTVDLSDSQTRERARIVLLQLTILSDQAVFQSYMMKDVDL